MRIAATSMTPIQVIESFRTKLQSIGISSFMQVNFESANSKIICESESDACLQRVSETGKRLRRVTGGAPQARRHSWRLADTQRGCSSERLRTGKKGETSERPSWAQAEGGSSGGAIAGPWPCERFSPRGIRHTVRSSAQINRVPYQPSGRILFVSGDDLPNECVLCRNTLYSGTCFQVSS